MRYTMITASYAIRDTHAACTHTSTRSVRLGSVDGGGGGGGGVCVRACVRA